jgi:DNA/RNA-binding domain of Phe-tRNA-synthetase-like protein
VNLEIVATDAWRSSFPGAVVGTLVMRGVRNPEQSAALDAEKRRLEERLRAAAASSERGEQGDDRVLAAYRDYYRSRGKTYQVKSQWESVARKRKPIPSRAALVEAMFMAELGSLILTAGHDLDAVAPPVHVDVTAENDRYVLLNGTEAVLAGGDMTMRDGAGIVASVLRGPDLRTRITPKTRNVLFVAYAPAGVGEDAVRRHLDHIRVYVRLITPQAVSTQPETVIAG